MNKQLERIVVFSLGCVVGWTYFSVRNNTVIEETITVLNKPLKTPVKIPQDHDNTVAIRQNNSLTTYDHLKKYLANGDYSEFMQRYVKLQATGEGFETNKIRKLILNQIGRLIEQNQILDALELSNLYLEYEYDDADALALLARLHIVQKNFLAAVDTLYKARSYSYEVDKIDRLNRTIRSLVADYHEKLKKQSDHLALLELYGRLTEMEPDYAPNYIGLAEAQIGLGNNEGARQALSLAILDPKLSARASELLNVVNRKPVLDVDNTTAVSLERAGDQFAVNATLNNSVEVTLLLDTGASLSIISSDTLARLGFSSSQEEKIGWFNTANGVVRAPIITLAGFSVGGHIAENIEVGIIDVSQSGVIDGLLGMNFLTLFKFYIDQNDNTLHLQLR